MSREPTFKSTAIRRQFSELANLIDDDITAYLIGGGSLTLEELKNATKDIELIVCRKSELISRAVLTLNVTLNQSQSSLA